MVIIDLPDLTAPPSEIKRLDDINKECITEDNRINPDKVEELGREAMKLFEQGYERDVEVYLHDYWCFHIIMNKGLMEPYKSLKKQKPAA
ncbi:hypothetical protein HYV49_05895 [Candidatus Pacearchaeota archaeon]|nr:hypothetical protein [Candidatus Pacearchaeota archaeon]